MKKGHTIRKRPLALFMALIMVFGLLPVSGVFAATEQTEEDVVNGSTPQVASQVKFLNSELTKAEIIYTVNPVKKETGSNIIFLVDASKAGIQHYCQKFGQCYTNKFQRCKFAGCI